MKKADVKVSGKYYANVSGSRTQIRIDTERERGGWDATNLTTNKKIVIKSAQRLQGAVGGRKKAEAKDAATPAKPTEAKNPKPTKATKPAAKQTEGKKPSASPGGKTPWATLYGAILREINVKGKESRFAKTERGKFAANG